MTLEPMAANCVLDAYFLEARCKLLELAGILDRIGRGSDGESVAESDDRYRRIVKALSILGDEGDADRAVRVQNIFSLEYDPSWKRPTPNTASNQK